MSVESVRARSTTGGIWWGCFSFRGTLPKEAVGVVGMVWGLERWRVFRMLHAHHVAGCWSHPYVLSQASVKSKIN